MALTRMKLLHLSPLWKRLMENTFCNVNPESMINDQTVTKLSRIINAPIDGILYYINYNNNAPKLPNIKTEIMKQCNPMISDYISTNINENFMDSVENISLKTSESSNSNYKDTSPNGNNLTEQASQNTPEYEDAKCSNEIIISIMDVPNLPTMKTALTKYTLGAKHLLYSIQLIESITTPNKVQFL